MSLPPGFKEVQTTEVWLKVHEGHKVRDVSRDLGTEGGVHRQLWKICDTCNKAHLYGLEHQYEDTDEAEADARLAMDEINRRV